MSENETTTPADPEQEARALIVALLVRGVDCERVGDWDFEARAAKDSRGLTIWAEHDSSPETLTFEVDLS